MPLNDCDNCNVALQVRLSLIGVGGRATDNVWQAVEAEMGMHTVADMTLSGYDKGRVGAGLSYLHAPLKQQ